MEGIFSIYYYLRRKDSKALGFVVMGLCFLVYVAIARLSWFMSMFEDSLAPVCERMAAMLGMNVESPFQSMVGIVQFILIFLTFSVMLQAMLYFLHSMCHMTDFLFPGMFQLPKDDDEDD